MAHHPPPVDPCEKPLALNILHPRLAVAAAGKLSMFGDLVRDFPAYTPISPNPEPRRDVASLNDPANALHRDLLVRACGLLKADQTAAGLTVQGALHAAYCAPTSGGHMDANARFLAWHRALLFFHERLMRWHLETSKVEKADCVRIPYWNAGDLARPPALYPGTPELENTNCRMFVPLEPAQLTTGLAQLAMGLQETDPLKASAGIRLWHNLGHRYVGGNMGLLSKAGHDPLFYAWHSNVDRFWSQSASENSALADDFCAFFDPYTADNQGWVKVNLQDFRSSEALGVRYAQPTGTFVLPKVPLAPSLELHDVELPGGGTESTVIWIEDANHGRHALGSFVGVPHTLAGNHGAHDHGGAHHGVLPFLRLPLGTDFANRLSNGPVRLVAESKQSGQVLPLQARASQLIPAR